ncbi:MAG: hypothetical protein RL318_1047 [Fibrobacterota bacterium]
MPSRFDLTEADANIPLFGELARGLNEEQRALLEHDLDRSPLLVLAGAGTGKTTSLTRRLARECIEQGSSDATLALTFTRKAAQEMRERAAHQLTSLGISLPSPWCGTFHSLGHRILQEPVAGKNGWQRLNRAIPRLLPPDEADHSRAQFWKDRFRQNTARPWTSLELERLRCAWTTPEALAASHPDHHGLELWLAWNEWKERQGIMDFEDMIGLSIHLLQTDGELAASWNARARTLMVDEYQDTNRSQFRLVKALLGPSQRLLAVGDDDQSIYGFRGADIENVLEFRRDFPNARLVKLERNYRSVQPVLDLANRVFPDKPVDYRKHLANGRASDGPRAQWWLARDEDEELSWLFLETKKFLDLGISPSQIAVLVRTNRQIEPVRKTLAPLLPHAVNSPEGLQIFTVHASKGLEWEAVLLPFLDAPEKEGVRLLPAAQDEERRLFYVAVTRARDHLRLSCASRRRKGDGWQPSTPLPWFKLVRPGLSVLPGRLRRLGQILSKGRLRILETPC